MDAMLRRIDREIEEIEAAIATIEAKIQSTYLAYAQSVAQAVQQQIVGAAYRLCTHDLPGAFLSLSLTERQSLQKDIQLLARSTVESMRQVLLEGDRSSQTAQETIDRLLSKVLGEASQQVNELLATAQIIRLSSQEDSAKVQLKLSEVEFTNRTVMSHRGELRVFSARLQQLSNDLAKKQKIKTSAEAEFAWRSSWTEV